MQTTALTQLYFERRDRPSDINQHMELLARLASLCDSVTEFGVREGNSTIAFLYGKPKKLTSYDICSFGNEMLYKKYALTEGVEFDFIQADTIRMNPIVTTDLLFIDTRHTYEHLNAELSTHAKMARKFLVFHDTSKFGDTGDNERLGIWPAVAGHLKQNPDWKLFQYFTHNNGLVVLCRSHVP